MTTAAGGPFDALRRAALLLGVEAVALAVLGLRASYQTAVGEEVYRGAALGLAALTLLAGVLVLGLASAVARGRSWARTPALVVQLVALPVGTDQVLSRQLATGPLLLLLAGATAFHLLTAPGSQSSTSSP